MDKKSSPMRVDKVDKRVLWPVLMGFFIMGFCDIVAPISGRIATEFPASQQAAVSFLPTMVFLWFLVLSTPLAALMNRIGRKAMSMIGYAFTIAGLLVPFLAGEGCALGWYFAGFGLLGIGNTALQVAINPLLATIVPGERMTSYLTVGQIFRNTSLLLLAPIVTALVALTGSWRLLLPIYAGLTVLGGIWLQFTTVAEPERSGHAAGMSDCFRLLRNRAVLLCTLGVACFIAGDVGIGFLSVRLIDNPDSILTTTGFYACRIVGTLVGAWVLVRLSDVKYLSWNMAGALVLCVVLLFVRNEAAIYAAVGLMGFAMACVFATFYAVATKAVPEQANGVAGLMIMAIAAGAVSGPRMRGDYPLDGEPPPGDAVRRPLRGLYALGKYQIENQINSCSMIRKIAMTLLLAACIWPALAQRPRTRVEWGVIGGINIPDYTTNMSKTDVKNKLGWQAGIVTAVNLGAFAIEPQILYVRQGLRIKPEGAKEINLKSNSIDVPVLVSLRLLRPFRFYAGPVFTVMNDCKQKSGGDLLDFGRVRPTMSYTVGAGVKLLGHMLIDLRYNGQFKGKEDVVLPDGSRLDKLRSYNVALSVGYLF